MGNQSASGQRVADVAGRPGVTGTLLSESRRWKRSPFRLTILPLIKAFEKKRRRKVERARVYGQLGQLSKLAALKRSGKALARGAATVSRPGGA